MNRLAVVEDQVNLFLEVSEKLSAKIKAPIAPEFKIAVFQSVNNWMMNEMIDKQQTERYAKKQQQQDEPPSQAQLNYAQDLGIEVPAGATKKQLSKLINDAKQ
jgi:hypothetical protein